MILLGRLDHIGRNNNGIIGCSRSAGIHLLHSAFEIRLLIDIELIDRKCNRHIIGIGNQSHIVVIIDILHAVNK